MAVELLEKKLDDWKDSPEYGMSLARRRLINNLREKIMKLPMGNMSIQEFDFVRETYTSQEHDHTAILFYSQNRLDILNAIYKKCT